MHTHVKTAVLAAVLSLSLFLPACGAASNVSFSSLPSSSGISAAADGSSAISSGSTASSDTAEGVNSARMSFSDQNSLQADGNLSDASSLTEEASDTDEMSAAAAVASDSAVSDGSMINGTDADSSTVSSGSSASSGNAASGSTETSAADTAEDIRKKIVYTGDVSIDTRDYDETLSGLTDLMQQYEGFVESSSEYDNGTEAEPSRSCYVTVKIPSAHFNDFMNGLGKISGKVTSKNISSSDMTRTYSDNADRIKALETEQKTLLDLLAKADSVDSMIAIQNELTDIRTELAQLHHDNSGIDYDVQYSSVSISVYEVASYDSGHVTFSERLRDAFGSSGQTFVHVMQNVLIALVYLIPYIIIVIVVIILIRRLLRRHRKH